MNETVELTNIKEPVGSNGNLTPRAEVISNQPGSFEAPKNTLSDQKNPDIKGEENNGKIDINYVRNILINLKGFTEEEVDKFLKELTKKNGDEKDPFDNLMDSTDPNKDNPEYTVDLAVQLRRTLVIIVTAMIKFIIEPDSICKGSEFLPKTPPDGQNDNKTSEYYKLKDTSWNTILKGLENVEGTPIDVMLEALRLNAENPPMKIKSQKKKAIRESFFNKFHAPARKANNILKRQSLALAA